MKVLWNWMVAGLLVSVSRCDATASSAVISGVARRLTNDETTIPGVRSVQASGTDSDRTAYPHFRRRMEDTGNEDLCDAAFMGCLQDDPCVDCFVELETKEIDWASVVPNTPCVDVVKFLNVKDNCKSLASGAAVAAAFCKTFDACVDWGAENGSNSNSNNADQKIDCKALKDCEFPGIHAQFLGDGICHERAEGCYNSAACGYDGGDCCPDTCKTSDGSYVECGHEGYACRDPASTQCDRSLNSACPSTPDNKPDKPIPVCTEGNTLYRLIMYDSFGDGWDDTSLTISDVNSVNTALFSGSLKEGSQGTEYICLSKTPSCYHVEVKGGTWGKEVSWEIKPVTEGSFSVAMGGSPMSCGFPIAGVACINTCTGRTDIDPSSDPDYREFKTMSVCIHDKCPIQVGACQATEVCEDCFQDTPADYCYANEEFNSLLDCAICKCTDATETDFCTQKQSPGLPVDPGHDDDAIDDDWIQAPCSPGETVLGGNAVLAFGKCTDFTEASMMVTNFDQNNFGMLDSFESCAHAWRNRPNHDGRTALGCLQILVNAKDGAIDENTSPDAPFEAISALADHLYSDPQNFCECASKASKDCPLCPSFMNFKTLLYESLDACMSLDEIDCGAWVEFYPKCKDNIMREMGSVNFGRTDQCDFMHSGCGGAGPFPVFRRLDCGGEVSADAWKFYTDYSSACLSDGPGPTPPSPTPPTKSPYISPENRVTASPVMSPSTPAAPSEKKKYIPPEDRGKKDSSNSDSSSSKGSADNKKPKSRFWRNLFVLGLLGGGAYYYHKTWGFDFSFLQRYRRFRPVPNFETGGGGEMYSGLTMESSTSFAPPSLPPPPSAMMGGADNNGGLYI